MKRKGFIVAGPWSGSGKTVITCGLIKALKNKGVNVAPFKIGPDYIDPAYLAKTAGRPCYNLDSWMTGKSGVKRSFLRGMKGAELAVVEGVMGLFDGAGGTTVGSTAEIASLLNLPIILIFPAEKFGHTAASLIQGLIHYWKSLNFIGVILNGIKSVKHEKLLKKALSSLEIPILGVVTWDKTLELPSRHLGLVQAEEMELSEKISFWGEKIAQEVNLSAILRKAQVEDIPAPSPTPVRKKTKQIAVAQDKAFSFCYQENLDILKDSGAELIFFSPLTEEIPSSAEGLYLPGGYPELFADVLSTRKDLHETLRKRVKEGMPVFAECGGFMFLLEALKVQGRSFPMSGVIPGIAVLENRLQAIGYRIVRFTQTNFLFPVNKEFRGHEFRYSTVEGLDMEGFIVQDFEKNKVLSFGIARENLIASYIHFHFGWCPEIVKNFIN